jgi:hypothetical protein
MKQATFDQGDWLVWLTYGPSVRNCSVKPRYQGLLCLIHAPIIVHCTRTQVILFPRLVYLANFRTRLQLASVFLVLVPMTCLPGHSTCRITLLVPPPHTHIRARTLFACQAWTGCGNARSLGMIRKQTLLVHLLVLHLLTVGGDRYPVHVQVHCSHQMASIHKCLSYTPMWI